jgi:hypothetical protein
MVPGAQLARGLGDHQAREREDRARPTADEERGAPAPARLDEPAEHEAGRGTDRHRGVEDRQDLALLFRGREVVDDRRRERRVARLADAADRARRHHRHERVREPRRRGRRAPHQHARRDQALARPAVGERAEDRRGQEVAEQERRREQPGLGVRQPEPALGDGQLELEQHRRHDHPIEVVQEVQPGEQGDDQSRSLDHW